MTEQPNRLIGLLQKDTGYYRAHSSFCPTLALLKSVLVLHLTLLSLFTQSYGRTGGSCFCLSVWKCLIFYALWDNVEQSWFKEICGAQIIKKLWCKGPQDFI